MKDIFNFIFTPNKENREKIFENSISEKRKLAFYMILIWVIFFEVFANLFILNIFNQLWKFVSIILLTNFITFLILYLFFNIIFSFLLHIFTKIFGNKKEFINTLLTVAIPTSFFSIIYGIIFWILFIIFYFWINLFFIIDILVIIVIIWTLWLFFSLLNWILEHKWKTFWTFILSLILPIIGISIYMNNIYNWYEEKARDSSRIIKISTIEIWMNNYFYSEEKLPEDFLDFSKKFYEIPNDPREWNFSKNGCEFTYKYEKISEKTYKISICPESKLNIEKAKNDGWTDGKRLEFIKEV